jgi:hypothetical protein
MISKLNAQGLAKQLGWDFPDKSDVVINHILSKKKELEEMLNNRGFWGAHGSTRRGRNMKFDSTTSSRSESNNRLIIQLPVLTCDTHLPEV